MKEFYILQYPKTIGKNWDVETNLQPWLTKLRSCRSSKILFLDATIQNLKERIERSGRPRKNIEDWFDIWYQPYTTFFMNHSNSFIVDTNTLNDLIVKQIVSDWILNSATD